MTVRRSAPGPDQSPVCAFLGQSGGLPQWHFGTYRVGRDGTVLALLPSDVTPASPQLRQAREQALAAP